MGEIERSEGSILELASPQCSDIEEKIYTTIYANHVSFVSL